MSEKLKLKRELSEACQLNDMLRGQLDEANAVIATYRRQVSIAYRWLNDIANNQLDDGEWPDIQRAVNEHLEEE